MSPRPSTPACFLVTLAAGLALALPPAAGQSRFGDVTQVTAVEIPVQVVRDGEPVRGLTGKDFEVYEGGKKQPVVGFDVVDLATVAGPPAGNAPSTPVPAAARRHFLVLFDLAYSETKSILKAQEAVAGVVIKNLTPSDLVAVATYSPADGTHLLLNFTADPRQIAAAIERIGAPSLVDRSADPLHILADQSLLAPAVGNNPVTVSYGQMAGQNAGLKAMAQEYLENVARVSERSSREQQTAQVSALTRAYVDLARLMAGVSGRKEVVYLSEGFDSSILQGVDSKEDQDLMALQASKGESYKIDSDKRYGNTRGNNELEKMMEGFRRADCVIQAVDIGGVRGAPDPTGAVHNDQTMGASRASGEAALFQMAHDTGGELYRNFNDLGAAMQQLLRKTSVTYVLTIQPEKLKSDGAYHNLRVELKNAQRGTRVSFRPGYYAPRPYSMQGGVERVLTAANELMSGAPAGGGGGGAVQTAVLAAPFRGAGDRAYVPVLIEADGNSLLGAPVVPAGAAAELAIGTLPAEIYVYAMDKNGAVGDYFVQTLALDLAKVTPALRQAGLKFFGHLELAPGDYAVRVLVRNGLTGAFGARVEPLTVPDFAAGKPVLLSPFFPERPGKWLMVKERPRGEQSGAGYPFMAGDRAYVPASRPALVSGQQAALALVGWNWGPGELKAEARVLSFDGRDAGRGELEVTGREPGSELGPERLEATFRPPPGLAPGAYELAVTVTGASGSRTVTLPFAVAAPGAGSA
jgi:VWFA-related protein